MSVNVKDVLDAGYREFEMGTLRRHADRFFQKTVRGENCKRYFITLYFYDHEDKPDYQFACGWLAAVRLYRHTDFWFDIDFHPLNEAGIQEMERFFEDAYSGLRCVPDCHNND